LLLVARAIPFAAVLAEVDAEVLGRRHDHAAGQQFAGRLLSVEGNPPVRGAASP